MATATGILTFDYRYEIYHAWFRVTAGLFVFANAEPGAPGAGGDSLRQRRVDGTAYLRGFGRHPRGGQAQVSLHIGGSNYDSGTRLEGTLTVSNFAAPAGEVEVNALRRGGVLAATDSG